MVDNQVMVENLNVVSDLGKITSCKRFGYLVHTSQRMLAIIYLIPQILGYVAVPGVECLDVVELHLLRWDKAVLWIRRDEVWF